MENGCGDTNIENKSCAGLLNYHSVCRQDRSDTLNKWAPKWGRFSYM